MKRGGRERARAFRTRSAAETFALAERMARRFTGREVVLLRGELGAGKTVFAQGLAAGCGVADSERVCSPTYTLVNVYQGRWPVFHIDLYRLDTARQVEDLGWEDFLGEGVVVVEWAEKVPFPLEGIAVEIAPAGGDERRISVRRA
jgi:tRNA threonylcarbamoyladenosine biosynthesis protein TsaE